MHSPEKYSPEQYSPEQKIKMASYISVIASFIIFFIKISGYLMTHSMAIFSDALESIVNVIAAIVALIVIRFVSEPADEEHPYGHGKLEYFSSAFEGGLIFFAALMIFFESSLALYKKEILHQLDLGMVIIASAAVLNSLLGVYLLRVGRQNNSETLLASGAHVLSDVWTTVGVVIGLFLVKITGISWIDPLAAMIVAINLGYTGFKIMFKSANGLIDAADPKVLQDLVVCLNHQKKMGIIDIHHTKIIRAGRFHHVDAHVVVPEFWDIHRAHMVADEFEKAVVKEYRFEGEIAWHLDPCKRSYCSICELEDCQIRNNPYKQSRILTVETIASGPFPPPP